MDRNNYGSTKTPPTGSTEDSPVEDYKSLMSRFTKFIYGYPGIDLGPIKTRAVLCHIYHHAIHDRWFDARDLMLMTHLQEGIIHADVPTQVCVQDWNLEPVSPDGLLQYLLISLPPSLSSLPRSCITVLWFSWVRAPSVMV